MMKTLLPLLPILILAAACSREAPPVAVDMTKRAEVAVKREPNSITFAYLPQYSHLVSYKRQNLLVEYLKNETGLNVKQVYPDTFDEQVKMFGQGKIDISFSNPFVYIKLSRLYGARALARVVELDGKKDFRGMIICRKDNPDVQTIDDCRGKRWIATDPSSAGGYLFALGHFIDRGIGKSDFARIDFAPGPGGKQEKVVLAVHAGKYDIGSVREGTLAVVADRIDVGELRVLAYTRSYPGWVYAVRRDLDSAVADTIRQALLKLDGKDPGHRKILDAAAISGVVASSESEFDPVRALAVKAGLDLSEEP